MNKITLSLSLNEVKILYKEATLERKLELEELFPELKPISIIDRVKTYEDALEVLKRDHFDENNLYPREIARRKLEIIIEALNEGWKPDLSNYQKYKWYPYFIWSLAGIEFSNSYCSPANAITLIGVLLCLKSKELADYIGSNFKNLYEIMLLG